MNIKFTVIICAALALVIITSISYNTNKLVYGKLNIYEWCLVVLSEVWALVVFSTLILTI